MTAPKTTRVADPVIVALAKVDKILAALDELDRHRVMDWLIGKYVAKPKANGNESH